MSHDTKNIDTSDTVADKMSDHPEIVDKTDSDDVEPQSQRETVLVVSPIEEPEGPNDQEWPGASDRPTMKTVQARVAEVSQTKTSSSRFWSAISVTMCAFGMMAMAYSVIRLHRENVAASAVIVIEKTVEAVKAPPPPAPMRVVKKIDASACKKNQFHMKGHTLTSDPSCTTITYSEEPQAQ